MGKEVQIQLTSIVIGLLFAALLIVTIEILFPYIWKSAKRLKIWWRSGQWTLPEQIQFRKGTGISSGRPAGIRGLFLLVITDRGQEMVSAGAALDQEQFWKTWKHLGGQVDGWMDEDTGEKINLTDL